ncbi:hypothetical protein QJS04_geneDACA015395 [Acorus gramineus]|uniref:Hydroxyproline-rich glycoprotein family protein n=1 Tax=Acorus gramineus TaxID=55184 RepID=A0AAV9A7F9_ACOGR|nr:hypothetical protein QJS04_geneDACA015395 [Acorus gramineus]
MKSSLRKLRGGFGLHKGDPKEKRNRESLAQLDELAQASQDMHDMRDCYDSLLSAAAATANSAYEFSESLREMGDCLLAKTALNDDEESGRVLLMLGKVQFELQKLVDCYRAHIVQTITTPSESLLNELRTVEEMKRQCDGKREVVKYMLTALKEKSRSRSAKGESFTSQQLQTAQEEYDDEATLFVFRLKSLKQGQSRSLLTQAARHHAAQLNFFRKALKSLEGVEPHVKLVSEQQHIEYQFSGLEDDEADDVDDDYGYDPTDDGELSFDYGQNDQGQEVISTSRNSMELDQVEPANAPQTNMETEENLNREHAEIPSHYTGPRAGSQSAPIFINKKFDPIELRPSSTRKLYTYVLPTPSDAQKSTRKGSGSPISLKQQSLISHMTHNLWHSSPLDPKKFTKDSEDDQVPDLNHILKSQSVLKESNINSNPIKMPPPLSEGLSLPQFIPRASSETKKIKRQAFSGPLMSKAWSGKPNLYSSGPIASASIMRVPSPQPSASPKRSPSASPPFMSSPKISELHELPRPPSSSFRPTRPNLIGHSAPLGYRSQDFSGKNKMPRVVASPLPTPPASIARSFSIPSSSLRSTVGKLLESPRHQDMTEEVASPPLTPISLTNIRPPSVSSTESVVQAAKTKGVS